MARWIRRQPLDRKVGGSRRPFSDLIINVFFIIFPMLPELFQVKVRNFTVVVAARYAMR